MAARFPMAVVVTGSPLTVTIEGASAVVAAEDFVGSLATDDRVQAAFLGDRLTVLAKAGGAGGGGTPEATAATPNTLALRDGDGQLKSADGVAADDVLTVGQAGQWQTYTPTVFNLTLGNGTITGQYTRVGDTITVRVQITVGSTTTVNAPYVSLPATSANQTPGIVLLTDTGSNYYDGFCAVNGSNFEIWALANSSHARQTMSNSFPFTWASGDQITATATYEAA